MYDLRLLPLAVLLLATSPVLPAETQQAANAPLPDIRQLIKEVQEHQKQLEKVKENYTYSDAVTTQEIDSNGQVKKTETEEWEEFFVNGHQIGRKVKKDGKAVEGQELEKETERVTKAVEKAQKTPSDKPVDGQPVSIANADSQFQRVIDAAGGYKRFIEEHAKLRAMGIGPIAKSCVSAPPLVGFRLSTGHS